MTDISNPTDHRASNRGLPGRGYFTQLRFGRDPVTEEIVAVQALMRNSSGGLVVGIYEFAPVPKDYVLNNMSVEAVGLEADQAPAKVCFEFKLEARRTRWIYRYADRREGQAVMEGEADGECKKLD